MKKACLLIVCLLLLTGCTTEQNYSGASVMVYNGELYDFQSNSRWQTVNGTAEWETVYVGFVDEENIDATVSYTKKAKILKNNPESLVIAYGILETNYYIKRGAIPSVYSERVEKVVFSDGVSTVTLEQENLQLWMDFLRQCHANPTSCQTEPWKKGVPDGFIYVYFSDFPLYYFFGYFGFSASGQLGFSAWDFEEYNTQCILLPENIAACMVSLLSC